LLDVCGVFLQPGKKTAIVDGAVLDDFSQTGVEFSFGKACKRSGINNNRRWLVKSAHQVFAFDMVDCRFSADRSVHLCEQGGWKLQEADPTHVRGRRKACYVPDHTATQRNYIGVTAGLHAHQLVDDAVPGFHGFETFAIGDYVYFNFPFTQ